MPRKLLMAQAVPTLVHERLAIWGRCIHAQRLRQRIPATELCERLGISEGTLRRLEKGDVGASAGAYLSALLALGVIEQAAPMLEAGIEAQMPGKRVKRTLEERGALRDAADYF